MMEQITLLIRCKIEELPFFAKIVKIFFVRDKAMFVNFSPLYGGDFEDRLDTQIKLVEDLIEPVTLTGEIKRITQRISVYYQSLKVNLNKIEKYLEMTDPTKLTIAPSDFGIRNMRQLVNMRNDEGMVRSLNSLLKLIEMNKTALTQVGYSPELHTTMVMLSQSLAHESVAQTQKEKERSGLVKNNYSELNKLWEMLIDIEKTGKIIAQEAHNKEILNEYTYSEVIKKVHSPTKKDNEKESPAPTNPA